MGVVRSKSLAGSPLVRTLRFESLESRQLLSGSSWPSRISAPYVDTTLYPTFNLASAEQSTGNRYYTLAFIVAGTSNEPTWGGQDTLSVASGYMSSEIAALRAEGGDVVVSFGGASGTELAQAVTNVTTLQADYQQVVNEYSLTRLDFDIEGAAIADTASIDRRSEALAGLQQAATAAGGSLQIWLTLPVLPSGLTAEGEYAVRSALSHGVNLSGVNIMTMDFGDSAAPSPSGKMGTYAIEAAQSTFTQVQSIYAAQNISITTAQLWQKIGITPMIGVNDQTDEVFDQAAAAQLLAFAEANDLGELAFWSATRDQEPTTSGEYGQAASTNSGITQTASQFTTIFEAYNTPGITIGGTTVALAGASTMTANFTVSLLPAQAQTVTVHYATADSTAKAGYDYVASSGTVTFAPGATQETISVPILPNPSISTSSQFVVNLSNPSGTTLASSQAIGSIVKTTNTLSATAGYETTSDWGTGYNGEIDLTDTGTNSISPWTLTFDLSATIGSLWNGTIVSHVGNLYTVENPSWGEAIAAGSPVSLGFGASPGGSPPSPTNYVLNGVPLGATNLTMAAGRANWTAAGLTLAIGSDGDEHIYTTGSTTDAVTPLLPASVSKVQVQGATTSASTLTVDFSSGDPIPSGGLAFTAQAGESNELLLTGIPAGETVTLSGSTLTVGSASVISLANVAFIGVNAGGTGVTGLTGTSGLVKTGASTMILSGTAAYAGPTTVSAGTLQINGASALPIGSSLVIGSSSSAGAVFGQPSVSAATPVATSAFAAAPDVSASATAISAPGSLAVPAFVTHKKSATGAKFIDPVPASTSIASTEPRPAEPRPTTASSVISVVAAKFVFRPLPAAEPPSSSSGDLTAFAPNAVDAALAMYS